MIPHYIRPGSPILLGTCPQTGKAITTKEIVITENFLVEGVPGSGKTLFLTLLALQSYARGWPVVILSGKDTHFERSFGELFLKPSHLHLITTVPGWSTKTLPQLQTLEEFYKDATNPTFSVASALVRILMGSAGDEHYGPNYWNKVVLPCLYLALKITSLNVTFEELAKAIASVIKKNSELRDAASIGIKIRTLGYACPLLDLVSNPGNGTQHPEVSDDASRALVGAFDLVANPEGATVAAKALLHQLFLWQSRLYHEGRALQVLVLVDDLMDAFQSGAFQTAVSQVRQRKMSIGIFSQSAEELAKGHRGGAANFGAAVKTMVATRFLFSPVEDIDAILQMTGERKVIDTTHSVSSSPGIIGAKESHSISWREKKEDGLDLNFVQEVLRTKFQCLVVSGSRAPYALRIALPLTIEEYERCVNTPWPRTTNKITLARGYVMPEEKKGKKKKGEQQPNPDKQKDESEVAQDVLDRHRNEDDRPRRRRGGKRKKRP